MYFWNRRSWIGTCWPEAPVDVAVSAQLESTVSNSNILTHNTYSLQLSIGSGGDSISSSSIDHKSKWTTASPVIPSSV